METGPGPGVFWKLERKEKEGWETGRAWKGLHY
jgi:hypothetical protein